MLEPQGTFTIGALLTARLGDADLNDDPNEAEHVFIDIYTNNGMSDVIRAVEQGEDRGVFAAILPDEYSNIPPGTRVTMKYVEFVDGSLVSHESSTVAIDEDPDVILNIVKFEAPETILAGTMGTVRMTITNDNVSGLPDRGSVRITGSDGTSFERDFYDMELGQKLKFAFRWTAPSTMQTVTWTAQVLDEGEVDDTATATTSVVLPDA